MSWGWPLTQMPAYQGPALPGLSARLAAVAHLAQTGHAVADIGTDHGRLPLAMVAGGWAPQAIGTDRAHRPLRGARRRVEASAWSDRVSLRVGDGLAPLAPGEVDVVVVAGVGGLTAACILTPGRLAALGVRRVVVQPNRDDPAVRTHLVEAGWALRDETLVFDGGRLFYVVAAEPGPAPALDPVDRWIGPLLRHRRDPLADAFRSLRRRWLTERENLTDRERAERDTVLADLDGRR